MPGFGGEVVAANHAGEARPEAAPANTMVNTAARCGRARHHAGMRQRRLDDQADARVLSSSQIASSMPAETSSMKAR